MRHQDATGWPEFDELTVPLDERDHAEEDDSLRPLAQAGRLETHGADQEVPPTPRS